MRHKPIANGYRHGHAMFLPYCRPAIANFISILNVVMNERSLVETFYGIAYGGDIADPAAPFKYRLAKTRPQSLAAASHELHRYVGYAHLPNTSISM